MSEERPGYKRKVTSLAHNSVGAVGATSESPFIRARKLAFRRHFDPSSITELLKLNNFNLLLGQSLIFIQNTRKSSDYLIETLLTECSSHFSFQHFQTHITNLNAIFSKMSTRILGSDRSEIWIIDSLNPSDNIGEFCRKVSLFKQRHWGVWIRGYIQDLHPRDLSFFNAVFAFRLSSTEYEILKSSIPITDKLISQMDESMEEVFDKRKVLTFLNYPKNSDAPLLKINPKVLYPPPYSYSKIKNSQPHIINYGQMNILKGKETNMNKIRTGDNINIGGTQSVTNINEHIDSKFNNSETSKLAESLKILTNEISSAPDISDKAKAEQLEVISHLTNEAAKPQPNKTMLKSLVQGLGGALKGVVGTAKVINAIDTLQDWTDNVP